MLDEIRLFLDALRTKPAEWPQNLDALDPARAEYFRSEFDKHWKLALQNVDYIETALEEIYAAGADDSAAIAILDRVVAIIRDTALTDQQRLGEIAALLLKSR